MTTQPRATETTQGFALNPAGLLRWWFEMDSDDFAEMKNAQVKKAIMRFQEQVRAAHSAATLVAPSADIQASVNKIGHLEEFTAAIKAGHEPVTWFLDLMARQMAS